MQKLNNLKLCMFLICFNYNWFFIFFIGQLKMRIFFLIFLVFWNHEFHIKSNLAQIIIILEILMKMVINDSNDGKWREYRCYGFYVLITNKCIIKGGRDGKELRLWWCYGRELLMRDQTKINWSKYS